MTHHGIAWPCLNELCRGGDFTLLRLVDKQAGHLAAIAKPHITIACQTGRPTNRDSRQGQFNRPLA